MSAFGTPEEAARAIALAGERAAAFRRDVGELPAAGMLASDEREAYRVPVPRAGEGLEATMSNYLVERLLEDPSVTVHLSTQVTAHEEAFALFQAYAKSGPDGSLRNAANSILPTLKMHNVRVQGLASPK